MAQIPIETYLKLVRGVKAVISAKRGPASYVFVGQVCPNTFVCKCLLLVFRQSSPFSQQCMHFSVECT